MADGDVASRTKSLRETILWTRKEAWVEVEKGRRSGVSTRPRTQKGGLERLR